MNRKQLIKKYIEFFKSKDHKEIQNASLIPENDPTVLFTTAGMHPLVPFLLGESHPQGKRLVNVQRCIRTGDIEEVGDTTHHTFFEMLGNWSLGDYWKKEAIEYSFEFLTKVDANIAGESSVHLEAALMNVYPIHYKLNNKYFDHYSYIKNGLIQNKFEASNDLVNFILSIRKNKPNIRDRAKYYVDTINTQYDGKSTQKTVEIIKNFVNTY